MCKLRVALLVYAAATWLHAAEPTATILGTVRDSSGAVVPGARVKAVNVHTGFHREATSGAEGNYIVPLLPIGDYRLTVQAPNFKTYEQQGITLTVNQNARVDAVLAVGAVQDTVSVKADAVLVDTANA